MILDLDAPVSSVAAWPRWRSLAALTVLFAAALAAGWTTTGGAGTAREQGLAWLASLQDRFAPAPTEAPPQSPPSVSEPAVAAFAPLTFPSRVATLLSRRSLAGTTGLISAGEADRPMVQSTYRLPDGRRAVLLQLAPRSPALVWSGAYVREPIEVRGFAATLDSPESRGQPVVLSWSEGRAVYQLYSTELTASELVVLADALR